MKHSSIKLHRVISRLCWLAGMLLLMMIEIVTGSDAVEPASAGKKSSKSTPMPSESPSQSPSEPVVPEPQCLAGVLEEEDYIDWGFGSDLPGVDLYSGANPCLEMDPEVFPTREEQYHGCLAMCSMINNCFGVTLVNNGFAGLDTPACCAKPYGWTFALNSAQAANVWSGEVKKEGPGSYCPIPTIHTSYYGSGVDLQAANLVDISLDESLVSTIDEQVEFCLTICAGIVNCFGVTVTEAGFFGAGSAPMCFPKGPNYKQLLDVDSRIVSAALGDDKADPICPNSTALQDATKTLVYLGQGVDLLGGDIYLDLSQTVPDGQCIQLADDTTFNQLQACMALCIMILDCTSITFASEDFFADGPQCCVKGSTGWTPILNADQRLYSATIPDNLPLPTPAPV